MSNENIKSNNGESGAPDHNRTPDSERTESNYNSQYNSSANKDFCKPPFSDKSNRSNREKTASNRATPEDWELESSAYYDRPSLEYVLKAVGDPEFQLPSKDDGDTTLYQDSEKDHATVHIRSMPRKVWDTIKYISITYPSEITKKISVTEGCLIHCGLSVIELIVKESPRGIKQWHKAYLDGDDDTLLKYSGKKYSPEYLGRGIGQTKKVYFLNEGDLARAMEIANTFGMSLSAVVTICMITGMAQSTRIIPIQYVQDSRREVKRFKKWLNGED